MPRKLVLILSALSICSAGAPSDEQIRKILAERIDVRKQSVGIVVGIVDSGGRRVIAHGSAAKGGSKPVDGDTLFEIGSITKVFTAQILADAVAAGTVKLDDPVSKYLPASVRVPGRNGREITLHDLVTHRSGLPRLPTNLTSTDLSNPYAAYTVGDLYEFLAGHKLRRDPGAEFEYSNLGVGLLGHVLALRESTSYERLVRAKILNRLGMKSTAIELSPEAKARMAQGHDHKLEPVSSWDLPALAGAGALRSSANDLLRFVAAHAGIPKADPVLASMIAIRKPAAGGDIGLGWLITKRGIEIVHHGGGTGGFQAFAGFDPVGRVGVVVLSNAQTQPGVDDLGMHLLDPSVPLAPPKRERTQVPFEATKFDAFTGNYRLAPNFVLSVTREDDRFYTQATGQPKVEIFAMSDRIFFPRVVDAELEFTLEEGSARASKVTVRQNGAVINGPRVEGPIEPARERTAIAVDPKILARYVGKYALSPNFHITVTREEGRIFAQATGQMKFEIFAESEAAFFYRVVDARITFTSGADGRAEKMTLHQGGMKMDGKRVE
jgi:CubicO group peptidase (beta-lactamase class C family)